jgi:hypothetical protein
VDIGSLSVGVFCAMRTPNVFRRRILATIRLRAGYPVQSFQNALPW